MKGKARLYPSENLPASFFARDERIYIRRMPNIRDMPKPDVTTIRVARKTRERLARHGRFGQSIDDVVNGVLDTVEEQQWIGRQHAKAADTSDVEWLDDLDENLDKRRR